MSRRQPRYRIEPGGGGEYKVTRDGVAVFFGDYDECCVWIARRFI